MAVYPFPLLWPTSQEARRVRLSENGRAPGATSRTYGRVLLFFQPEFLDRFWENTDTPREGNSFSD